MRRTTPVLSLILVLTTAGAAVAQTADPDLHLLADQNGVPPNVLVLFDTSGSMSHVVWHPDFDPKIFHDAGSPCSAAVYSKGTRGECPGSGRSGDVCPDNDIYDYVFSDPVPGLASRRRRASGRPR